ncbi:hypothetical protein [Pseudomonas protegens]|uniref:hypothetical protein n=1 Tax=Pseudomonas protegens TaxID=380021 RepID=UPI00223AD126|nr:hypothetical protein [Pseudomonas protegens]
MFIFNLQCDAFCAALNAEMFTIRLTFELQLETLGGGGVVLCGRRNAIVDIDVQLLLG